MALSVPQGAYGYQPSDDNAKKKEMEENEHNGLVSYKMLDSTNISHREIQLLREQIWRMRHPNAEEREQLWPNDIEPKVTSLKDIATQRIYQWESETTWFRAYEVELHQFTGFSYVLDFTGTTNHEIQGTFGVNNGKVEANLQPFELETICLISRNKLDPFKFSVKMNYTTTDVHPAILQTALAMNEHRIKSEYDTMINEAGVKPGEDIESIRSKCKKAGLEFVDPDFYPSVGALYIDGEESDKIQEEQVMWRRSADFCLNAGLFKDDDGNDASCEKGVSPEDIKQGRLGNCWFCCCLASMAERPELIEQLFKTKNVNKEGIWEVYFWHNGVRKVVILDDYFPCKPFSGPVYTKTGVDELWVAILEKAYAKLFGCYERLISGSPYHALPDLTGNPAEIYELHDEDHVKGLWEKLLAWNKSEDNLMSVACDETSRMNPTEAGLMLDHSYTVLDGKEGKVGGKDIRLLEIRNPWGHGEWKGDWSDFSPLWTKTAMNVFGVTDLDPDDGAFWMCWEDFLNYFTALTVCYCRRDWKDCRIGIELEYDHSKNELVSAPPVKLIVPNGQNVNIEWFGIFQQDTREKNSPPYLDLALFIFELKNGNERIPVGWCGMESARQTFQQFGEEGMDFTESLPGGTYLIVPFTSGRHWDKDTGNVREIGICCHAHGFGGSKNNMTMTELQPFNKNDIDQVILDMCMGLGEEKLWHDLERRHLRVGQMDLYCGKNNSKNKILTFSMTGTLDNIYNSYGGYPDLSQGCAFQMNPQQCAIFGVQVMIDPKQPGQSQYKFGLKSRPYKG